MPDAPSSRSRAVDAETDPESAITPGLAEHPGHLARRLQQMTYVVWTQVVSTTVTPPQFVVLHVLGECPSSDQTTLSERSHLDQSTIADLTRRLIAKGYVRRERDPEDRRRNMLALTDEGSAVLAELYVRTAEMNEIVLGTLSPPEQRSFIRLAQRVIESTERLIPKAPRRGRLQTFTPGSPGSSEGQLN